MTTRNPTDPTCRHCNRTFTRRSSKGRPPNYCSPACRSAAYRARTTPKALPVRDPQVARIGDDVVAQARRLGRLARATDPHSALKVLKQLSALQREMDDFTAVIVQQARSRGAGWNAIGEVLHISGDTARSHWSTEQVERRLHLRRQRIAARTTPRQNTASRRPQPTPQPPTRPRPPRTSPDNEADRTGPRRGTVFSHTLATLHRNSGKTLRGLAREAGISASFASRVLNGDRHPSWRITEALAMACGADPNGIRPVWENSRTHQRTGPYESSSTVLDHQALSLFTASGTPRPPEAHYPSDEPQPLTNDPADSRALLRLAHALRRQHHAERLQNPSTPGYPTPATWPTTPERQQPSLPAAAFG